MVVGVCVVGAGVVGICTAWAAVEQIENCHVTVLADNFTNHTTSHGAAGIWNPQSTRTPSKKAQQLCQRSWDFFNRLAQSPEGNQAGVAVISGFQLYDKPMPPSVELYRQFVYDFDQIDPKSLMFLPDKIRRKLAQAYRVTTLIIECRKFLPWAMQRLRSTGRVRFITGHVSSFQQILDENHSEGFEVIFNCTGLESRKLCGDYQLKPVRGQTIRVQAPWMKHFIIHNHTTCIIPGQDNCVLGTVHQVDDWDLSHRRQDAEDIWKRCLDIAPSLQNAIVEEQWVGLRPFRSELRIEEGHRVFSRNGQSCRIIHNYGHGGDGVGLSMGSAVEAVSIFTNQSQPTSLAKL